MDQKRVFRIQSEIQKIISNLLINGLKNTRISKMTAVSQVKLSRDLSFADVYISIYGNKREKEETMEALEHAKGYIRSVISKELDIRTTPELRFKLDESVEYSIKIQNILIGLKNNSNNEDEEED